MWNLAASRPARAPRLIASRLVLLRRFVVTALAALVLTSCGPAITEIVVVVDSDLLVPSEMDEVQIRVANEVATTLLASRSVATSSASTLLPATVGVRPGQDAAATITITAAARLAGADVLTS